LCTSIPAIWYGVGLSRGSGERASSHQSGSRAIVGAPEPQRRSIIRSITHAPDQTVARPRRLHWLGRSRRSTRRHCAGCYGFSLRFAG
jgi:hypothetical protein